MKIRTEKCEITAFLSLIFVLLASFILSMTESVMIQTSKNQKREDVDRAIFSVFGEYQKQLLEEYDVFAFDAAYGSGQYSEEQILSRMSYYGAAGIQQEVSEIQLLTDNQGQAFREQVRTFMEEKSGLSLAQDLAGIAASWEQKEIEGNELVAEMEQESVQEGSPVIEESGTLIEAEKGEFLSIVYPKDFQISGKAVVLNEQVSMRNRNTGHGTFPARMRNGGMEDRLLFLKYITDKFSNAVEPVGGERSLDYELEYIISGKTSDRENLNAVVKKLLIFRMGSNAVYLFQDTKKQEEALALATAISVILVKPIDISALKQLILIMWCFGESVMDIRSLLEGKRIPVVKTEESWQLSLSNLFKLGTDEDAGEGIDSEQGWKYSEYLQALLFLENEEELTMRTLDRIEQNLRTEQNLSNFRVDACVTKMKCNNTASIWNDYTYSFPIYYGYL